MTALRQAAPERPAPLGLNEEALCRAMFGLFITGGFAAMVAACHRQQKRIARENRAVADQQGWIA